MSIRMKVKLRKINMLDDFFVRALIAGIGVALVTGPLGCFVVWRRLSYFGDTLSHSALLGVILSVSFDIFPKAVASPSVAGVTKSIVV